MYGPGIKKPKAQGGYTRTFSMLLRIVKGLHTANFNSLLFFSNPDTKIF